MHSIRLKGARTHNLKGIDLVLAPGELVALVGPSGSGKSSLAMGTLYAEGQRRFVESFSAYARQFLERLPRPDVDLLEPVPAAVAVDRQGSVRTSRSTVASLTDVIDYAKNLWSHQAGLVCPTRGEPIVASDPQRAAESLLRAHPDARVLVLCREPVSDAEGFVALRERLVEQGYRRVQVAGEVRDLDGVKPSDVLGKGRRPKLQVSEPQGPCEPLPAAPGMDVVIDRLRLRADDRVRLVEALEVAFERGGGVACVELADSGGRHQFATHLRCGHCQQRFSQPVPGAFSFNSAVGACGTCRGFGRVMAVDWDKVLDPEGTLARGGIAAWSGKSTAWERRSLKKFAPEAGVPLDVPIRELSEAQRGWLLEGDGRGWRTGWGGLKAWFRWMEGRTYKMHVRVFLSRYRKYDACPDCEGTRFAAASRMWQVRGASIDAFLARSVDEALVFVRDLMPDAAADPAALLLLRECETRLALLAEVGLGYLSLDRSANTLSGGELQRVALTSALGASLTGALFVLDEPTVGLHPRDVERLSGVIRRLANAGNTVLVIEHDLQLIDAVDRVIELGPGAGDAGGQRVFDGTPAALRKAATATGEALRARARPPSVRDGRKGGTGDALVLEGASGHNLQAATVRFPRGRITCVTGVSGSGKSSLVGATLVPAVRRERGQRDQKPLPFVALTGAEALSDVVHVDQSALVRTPRGNPATYVGAWDVLRKRLANCPLSRERGYKPGVFSLNVQGGRCEVCKGQGYETVEMQFLADVTFSCAACGGRRFVGPVLDVTLEGLDVAALLDLTVDAALSRFANDRELGRKLTPLVDVGLGYLSLGQPLNTLSGGEAQRVKLAQALATTKPGALLVLDEPTAGLHAREVAPLLGVLERLATRGDTVVVIEHDMRLAAFADHVIDLGPAAGSAGGQVVAQGSPTEVAACELGLTSTYLAAALNPRAAARTPKARRKRREPPAVLSVHGAAEHNLRHVDVDIPRGQLVVVTGPSGSGKSSLAFGVVYAEGQRRYVETLSPYARQYLPQLPRPAVDRVTGVPPTLSLEQRIARAGANSTVATLTEVAHYLRLLYARLGRAEGGDAAHADALHGPAELTAQLRKRYGRRAHIQVFAPVVRGRKGLHRDLLDKAMSDGFELARVDGEERKLTQGMSLERFKEHDVDLWVAKLKTGDEGLAAALRQAAERADGFIRVKVRGKFELLELTADSGPRRASQLDPRLFSFNTRQGACPACDGKGQVETSVGRGKARREELRVCPDCQGSRLSKLARGVLLHEKPITAYLGLDVGEAREALGALVLDAGLEQRVGGPLLAELDSRLAFLERVGVGYLGLDRAADTLSGGEMQRVRLAAQLGSGLTGVLYVLDEPTIGLHPSDTARLLTALRGLVDRGNSALVVEHDTDTILAADHVIDMGPGGGHHGGRIVAQGSPRALQTQEASVTGPALRAAPRQPATRRSLDTAAWLELRGARANNLRGVDVRLPVGCLTAVTGVSGSGKSTLVREVLLRAVRQELGLTAEAPGSYTSLRGVEGVQRAVEVDQTPIGRTPRSVPATYVGVWDPIRKLLAATPEARARGFTASRFSFNVAAGRCPVCDGNGALSVEMSFLPDAQVPCDACHGLRFSPQTREARLFGLDAGQILELEVEEAVEVFSAVRQVRRPLELLVELGLGYLRLGQPSNTLSGGEAQRLKLVAELSTGAGGPTLYVLDEPTTGLHRADVARLLDLLERFVERGDTLLVIEHHADVMTSADWLIDLGPEGGRGGGQVVDMGPPRDVAHAQRGPTGRVLAAAMGKTGRG